MNSKLALLILLIGSMTFRVMGEEKRFQDINVTLRDLENPVKVGDDTLLIRMYSGEGGVIQHKSLVLYY